MAISFIKTPVWLLILCTSIFFYLILHQQNTPPTMAAIRVHGMAGSPATYRALSALFEKDLDVEFIPVQLGRENKTPQYLARNPFGQVPAFEHGDLRLFESRAITKYITEAYADRGTSLISKDVKKAAIETVWMEAEAQKFDPATSKLNWELFFRPLFGIKPDEAIVAEFEKKLGPVLDVYEKRLTESKYLGGDSFSLADLHHQANTQLLFGTKVKRMFDARPHVSAWAADILSRPAWKKVLEMLPV